MFVPLRSSPARSCEERWGATWHLQRPQLGPIANFSRTPGRGNEPRSYSAGRLGGRLHRPPCPRPPLSHADLCRSPADHTCTLRRIQILSIAGGSPRSGQVLPLDLARRFPYACLKKSAWSVDSVSLGLWSCYTCARMHTDRHMYGLRRRAALHMALTSVLEYIADALPVLSLS
jgi:hypothetical protein